MSERRNQWMNRDMKNESKNKQVHRSGRSWKNNEEIERGRSQILSNKEANPSNGSQKNKVIFKNTYCTTGA